VSESARKRMSLAQKARWAKLERRNRSEPYQQQEDGESRRHKGQGARVRAGKKQCVENQSRQSAGILGVLQLNVCAKSFMEHFSGFSLCTRSIGHGFFDADDFMALRALAEAMTGAIHFVLWSKPTRIGQFWFFHTPVSHRPNGFTRFATRRLCRLSRGGSTRSASAASATARQRTVVVPMGIKRC
jgi:hypothetical protein